MVRIQDLWHRRNGSKGSRNEQFLYPYTSTPQTNQLSTHINHSAPQAVHPASQAYLPATQNTTQTSFATDPGYTVANGFPEASQSLDVGSKFTLSATYSPTEGDFPVAPPGYVSREPSAAVPPTRAPPLRPSDIIQPEMPVRAPPSAPLAMPPARAAPMTPEPHQTTMRFAAPITAAHPIPSAYVSPRAPADRPMPRRAGQRVTAEELHELADWIRRRYQLDVMIYEDGDPREEDRDITERKINEAEALMSKIRGTVELWNHPSYFREMTGDYERFQEIARRINLPGKQDWIKDPPWANASIQPQRNWELR